MTCIMLNSSGEQEVRDCPCLEDLTAAHLTAPAADGKKSDRIGSGQLDSVCREQTNLTLCMIKNVGTIADGLRRRRVSQIHTYA